MDEDNQSNHLKAYGIAYWVLQNDIEVDWLLNYRGGSFLIKNYPSIQEECVIRGVSYEVITSAKVEQIKLNISKSIKQFNTFGLDVVSNDFNIAKNEDEIINFLNKHSNNNPIVLGGGSNILFKKDVERPVLKIEIKGINVVKEDSAFVYISVGAGENWDNFVNWSLRKDYGGIENLSLIPGNVGSAPIQNIGAYGVELDSVFESCRAISLENKKAKKVNYWSGEKLNSVEANSEIILSAGTIGSPHILQASTIEFPSHTPVQSTLPEIQQSPLLSCTIQSHEFPSPE